MRMKHLEHNTYIILWNRCRALDGKQENVKRVLLQKSEIKSFFSGLFSIYSKINWQKQLKSENSTDKLVSTAF